MIGRSKDSSMLCGMGRGRSIVSLSLVPDISDIARVGISNIVGYNLGAAIGKSNTVFSRSGITIPVLRLSKVGARVLISDSIVVLVHSRAIIRFSMSTMRGSSMVGGLGGIVRGGGMSNRGMVGRCSVNGGMKWGLVGGIVVDWGVVGVRCVDLGMAHWVGKGVSHRAQVDSMR